MKEKLRTEIYYFIFMNGVLVYEIYKYLWFADTESRLVAIMVALFCMSSLGTIKKLRKEIRYHDDGRTPE